MLVLCILKQTFEALEGQSSNTARPGVVARQRAHCPRSCAPSGPSASALYSRRLRPRLLCRLWDVLAYHREMLTFHRFADIRALAEELKSTLAEKAEVTERRSQLEATPTDSRLRASVLELKQTTAAQKQQLAECQKAGDEGKQGNKAPQCHTQHALVRFPYPAIPAACASSGSTSVRLSSQSLGM